MRNNASRSGYAPRHGDKQEVPGASCCGLSVIRSRVARLAIAGVAVLAVIILAMTAKTYASQRVTLSGDATVQAQNEKASKSKCEAKQALSTVGLQAGLSMADFNDIPAGDAIQAFSLVGGKAPACSNVQLAALEDAVAKAEELGEVGFVFYDLTSGEGVAYHSDLEIYGASSYKAPYALYVCESLVETGQVSLDDPLGTYGSSSMGWQTVRDLIEAAVVNSDNDSYIALRSAFDQDGYEDWVASLDIDDAPLDVMSDFPTYCPCSSAKLWHEMSEYLNGDTETSQWLSGLLAATTRSFIRDGIADDQVLVRNKGGWICEGGYYSTCDAGLIDADDHAYVMSIMTSMPWSDQSGALVSQIASALYDMRAVLS